jgi:hypothetical protein
MKIKHSKYKNTGILFELLTRQITSDTISGGNNKALSILKKYFNSKSELLKEYKIYNALSTKKYKDESKATILVDTLIEAHSKLNKSRLRREKYNLIKELKSTYDLNNFFKAKITNYKVMASIFNITENTDASPLSIVDTKVKLVEHIVKPIKSIKKNVIIENYNNEDQNTRLLTQKILLEKFNEKYKSLGENQKTLLQEYVNAVSNSPSLKTYINSEIKEVKKQLTKYSSKVTDEVVKIKLDETKNMIKPLCKKSSVHDGNVSNLLNYYELVNELKTIHG